MTGVVGSIEIDKLSVYTVGSVTFKLNMFCTTKLMRSFEKCMGSSGSAIKNLTVKQSCSMAHLNTNSFRLTLSNESAF